MITEWTLFKVTDIIPIAGKYRCVVCKLIVEIPANIIEMKKTFFTCPICHSGAVGGPKGVDEEIWEYLG